jgi:hypothetical protein
MDCALWSWRVNISYVRVRSQIYKYWSIHYGAFYGVRVLKEDGGCFPSWTAAQWISIEAVLSM